MLSLVVPFCGIPALVFAVRSQVFYRQGDVNASRAANLNALRLITAAGVCLCVIAVTASVLIAVFSRDDRTSIAQSVPTAASSGVLSAGSSARQRPKDMSQSVSAFEKALQRHKQQALSSKPSATNNLPRRSGGFGTMIGNIGRAGFNERRTNVSNTPKPTFEAGLTRRFRTRNG